MCAYTDAAPELKLVFDELDYPGGTATPHRPETNGVAERAGRRVREGTSCAMIQCGWDYVWWDLCQNAYCFLRKVVDEQRSGHTSYYARYGENFGGPVVPVSAEVSYKPITQKDIDRLHKLGSKMLSGIFLGYEQNVGG